MLKIKEFKKKPKEEQRVVIVRNCWGAINHMAEDKFNDLMKDKSMVEVIEKVGYYEPPKPAKIPKEPVKVEESVIEKEPEKTKDNSVAKCINCSAILPNRRMKYCDADCKKEYKLIK